MRSRARVKALSPLTGNGPASAAWRALWTFALVLTLARAGAAQDQGLDPLLFSGVLDAGGSDTQARAVQLYRLPFGYHLRKMDEDTWGVRITFPMSFTGLRITQAASNTGPFVKSLGILSVVPGLELEIPVGDRGRVRPFAEAGIGRGTDGGRTEVLFGTGLRASTFVPFDRGRVTYGGSGMYRKRASSEAGYDGYGTFEAGADAQFRLGFSVRQKPALGGIYGIARVFDGLDLKPAGGEPIVLRDQFEAGISFSTMPDLRVWKITLPWLAIGYKFGPVLSGVRVYATFPF